MKAMEPITGPAIQALLFVDELGTVGDVAEEIIPEDIVGNAVGDVVEDVVGDKVVVDGA